MSNTCDKTKPIVLIRFNFSVSVIQQPTLALSEIMASAFSPAILEYECCTKKVHVLKPTEWAEPKQIHKQIVYTCLFVYIIT